MTMGMRNGNQINQKDLPQHQEKMNNYLPALNLEMVAQGLDLQFAIGNFDSKEQCHLHQ